MTGEKTITMTMNTPFKSFERKTYISAKCCKCGEVFCTLTDSTSEVFETKQDLIDALIDYDWKVVKDKVYCESCK